MASEEDFKRLRQKVLEKRPVFKDILEHHGRESLYDYLNSYTTAPLPAANPERQQELITTFKQEVSKRLGHEVAESAGEQLRKYYYASTTDHYGPIYHPWVLNFNLVTTANYLAHPDPLLKNVITLACGNVSLNNFSFPRGLGFTSLVKEQITSQRLSLLPSNSHAYAVYNFRPYEPREVKKVKKVLDQKFQSGEISNKQAKFLIDLFAEIYDDTDVVTATNYADQVTLTNAALWKKIVPANASKDINFVYIEQEVLVAQLLIQYHLHSDTFLHKVLFDQSYEEHLATFFEHLPESFSRDHQKGTYLFWGLPKGGKHRLRLWREGNRLASTDGSFSVELTPEAIAAALASKELVPCVLLTFIVRCFYYGLKCLGGLGQINYLPRLHTAFITMQKALGLTENITACEKVETKHLGGEVTTAFLGGPNGELVPATSLDLLLYGDATTWDKMVEASKHITVEEALYPMLPEDYPMHYMGADRDPILSAIKAKDIAQLIRLTDRVTPCAYLRNGNG